MSTGNKKGVRSGSPGFLGRMWQFLREVRWELSRVIWPDRPQIVTYTLIVTVAVLVVASASWVVDTVVTQLLRLVI